MTTVLAISDNPLLTTGFAQVCRPVYEGFVNQGWNLHVIGVLSGPYDYDNSLRYRLYPSNWMDEMGYDLIQPILTKVNPDIVWVLTDPGNLYNYLYREQGLVQILRDIRAGEYRHIDLKEFKIVAYVPIEGEPMGPYQLRAIQTVKEEGGEVVLYCKSAVRIVKQEWPDGPDRYIYHGLDHGHLSPLHHEDRKLVRQFIGIDDKFVVGVFGANKRTKNYPEAILTARAIKDRGYGDRIIFYMHTEWDKPVSQGLYLNKVIEDNDVKDMIIVKPDLNSVARGNAWSGIPDRTNTIAMLKQIGFPPPPSWYDSAYLWNGIDIAILGDLDYNVRLNMLDLLFDPASVEGWGFLPGEAARCMVPTLGPRDNHVRDEVYGDTRFIFPTLDPRLWDFWHTGSRLLKFDPNEAAEKIIYLHDHPELIEEYGLLAYENTKKYRWSDAVDQMVNVIKEVL